MKAIYARASLTTAAQQIRSRMDIRLGSETRRRLDRLAARLGTLLRYGGRALLFLLIAVGGGFGSAWYATMEPTTLTAMRSGPWVAWTAAGRPDADPYTIARFARLGSLPMNAGAVLGYEARVDSDGRRLQSTCEYVIEGAEPAAGFWTLAVYDGKGRLIPNPADRYAFNAANLTRNVDGTIAITLSRDARPGNWLPVGAGGWLVITLTLYGVRTETIEGQFDPSKLTLPRIRRIGCV